MRFAVARVLAPPVRPYHMSEVGGCAEHLAIDASYVLYHDRVCEYSLFLTSSIEGTHGGMESARPIKTRCGYQTGVARLISCKMIWYCHSTLRVPTRTPPVDTPMVTVSDFRRRSPIRATHPPTMANHPLASLCLSLIGV